MLGYPAGMRNTYAILALRRKRAHLAGEIEAAERAIARQRASLANLDAALLLFDAERDPTLIPSVRPIRIRLYFRHGEQIRLCLEAVREADAPLETRQVAAFAMRAKGLDTGDLELLAAIVVQVRVALHRLAAKGLIFRIGGKHCVWGNAPVAVSE